MHWGDRRGFLKASGAAILLGAAGCAREDLRLVRERQGRQRDHDSEGGIGGTGVFGPVTDLGSIIVAGRRIATPEGLLARSPFGPAPADAIPVGAVVSALAREEADGLVAEAIDVVTALAGPVTAISGNPGRFDVMGVRVRPPRSLRAVGRDGRPEALSALRVGDRVAVSGLWRQGDVVATRVERLGPGAPDVASGLLFPDDDAPRIEGLRLAEPPDGGFGFVAARGRWRPGAGFEAALIDRRGLSPFPGPAARAVVDGFMARDPVGQGHHMAGVGLPRDRASDAPALVGVRALFEGRLVLRGDRRFEVERAEPL